MSAQSAVAWCTRIPSSILSNALALAATGRQSSASTERNGGSNSSKASRKGLRTAAKSATAWPACVDVGRGAEPYISCDPVTQRPCCCFYILSKRKVACMFKSFTLIITRFLRTAIGKDAIMLAASYLAELAMDDEGPDYIDIIVEHIKRGRKPSHRESNRVPSNLWSSSKRSLYKNKQYYTQ